MEFHIIRTVSTIFILPWLSCHRSGSVDNWVTSFVYNCNIYVLPPMHISMVGAINDMAHRHLFSMRGWRCSEGVCNSVVDWSLRVLYSCPAVCVAVVRLRLTDVIRWIFLPDIQYGQLLAHRLRNNKVIFIYWTLSNRYCGRFIMCWYISHCFQWQRFPSFVISWNNSMVDRYVSGGSASRCGNMSDIGNDLFLIFFSPIW